MRPRINMNGTTTYVLIEQTRAVNPETRLGDFAGRLDADELVALNDALRIVFGLY
jgi:mRNA interferase MazF